MDVRRNIYSLTREEVANFVAAVQAMKASGVYDTFIQRHNTAMMTATLLPGESGGSLFRNAAHRGPSFLPWHRQELRDFELALRAALPGKGVTLPYWDWAADAALPDPRTAALWTDAYIGGDGDPGNGDRVPDGPFRTWTALIFDVVTGTLAPRGTPGLVRRLGRDPGGLPTLPEQAHVDSAMTEPVYDSPDWSAASDPSFRNRLEGWLVKAGDPPDVGLHNRVHTWVGGDMLPGTSPNDPVFFLHHCNVDRLWARWQAAHPEAEYRPASGGPPGHNRDDPMSFLSGPVTPAAALDHHALGYRYDTEPSPPRTSDAPGASVLAPAAVAMLAHARLGDVVDGLERKVNGGRVRPVAGGFTATVRPTAVERQVLALAKAAQTLFRDGSTVEPAPGHPLGGLGGYALMGAFGLEIPGYAGLLMPPGEGWQWVTDALRRGTPDPNRSRVAVPAAELALRAGQRGLAEAADDRQKARIRAFAAGLLAAGATGTLVSPQMRGLMAADTNQDWERWRVFPGARAVDEAVRRRLLASATPERLGSWFPPPGEVPEALWNGLLAAIEQVYGLPAGRVAGFADFEEGFTTGEWLTVARLANGYRALRENLGTSSWHWTRWWGLLAPLLLGPSATLLASRALPAASAFSIAGAPITNRALFELVQLGMGVGSVTPFVYSMLLWAAIDEHTDAFVNALALFVARAALATTSLAVSGSASASARWLGLFVPLLGTDVYAATRAVLGRARPGVATVFGLNTAPSLTAAASLGFGGLIKLLVDETGSNGLWWLGWGLLTAGALGAGVPIALALSNGGGIWSWFLRRDPRLPLRAATGAAGADAAEPVAFARVFDDSTLWADPASGPPASGPDLVHTAYPSGMRALARVWREGGQRLQVAHDDHTVRLRPEGSAELAVTVGPEGATASAVVGQIAAALAGVTDAHAEAYATAPPPDPDYRLPWPATFADPGDAGPIADHKARRILFEAAGAGKDEALILRHSPRAETSTTAGLAGVSRIGTDAFPVVPASGLGDLEGTGLGSAADLAVVLTMAAAPALLGGTVTVSDGVAPALPAAQASLGEVSEVFRRWNLDERRLNEWRMLVAGGAASEKAGAAADADPLMRPRAAPNPAPAGEPFATAMGWVPLWRAWLRVATDPAADASAAVAMPYTPSVTLADGAHRRLRNDELTLGVRFLLELE